MGSNHRPPAPDLPLDALGHTLNTSHGACGKSWHGAGDKTSHCGGCHATFATMAMFDFHRNIVFTDPQSTPRACKDPATLTYHGHPLELGADDIWFSPSDSAKAKAYWAAQRAENADEF